MSHIVEQPDANRQRVLLVGDNNEPISFKTYQDIYHQITGRTEQIRRRYPNHLLMDFATIEQLHHKIMQLCDVHHVVAQNESVTLFLDKERKEQYSSFERFRTYNASSTTPCVSVLLKYDFSLALAGLAKPQCYSVTIRLTSRLAAMKQAEERMPAFMRGRLAAFVSEQTAEITVEYADYVVARGFMQAFDEWVGGCRASPDRPWLEASKGYSHWIPPVLRGLMVTLMAWFALEATRTHLIDGGLSEAVSLLILYGAGGYVLALVGGLIGRVMEEAIDAYPILSYIHLNRGDESLVEAFKQRRQAIWTRTGLGWLTAIALSVAGSRIERWL